MNDDLEIRSRVLEEQSSGDLTGENEENYNKLWEELKAYFPLIEHGPRKNDAIKNYFIVPCVFVAAVTFIPIRCLVTIIQGYTYRHTN
jgi:hypothetical protein